MIRWIKEKWRNLKERVSNEWSEYTTRDFYSFVGNIGGSALIVMTFISVSCLIVIITGLYVPLVMTNIMLQWLVLYVGVPLLTLLIGCVGLTKYLERFHRRYRDRRYWTTGRLDSFSEYTFFTMMTCLIVQFTMLIFIVLPLFGTTVFTATALVYVTAISMMVVDIFWMPWTIYVVFVSLFHTFLRRCYNNVVHIEYIERITRIQNDTPRGDRRGTSYAGEPTEDELLDYKLERLGL